MIERKMDDRGSKSDFSNKPVKEQRVDGNQDKSSLFLCLRCTLMDFERNYQIRTLSKQNINQIRSYSSISNTNLSKNNLSWFITGLIDAEGCFIIGVSKSTKNKIGWSVKLVFKIGLHIKDKALLEQVKNHLNVGKLYQDEKMVYLRVESLKDLLILINFLDNYKLITKKYADYLLFKEAVNIKLNNEHLTLDGLTKIVSIKSSMNRGELSTKLNENFSSRIPIERPLVPNLPIPDPQWVAGFTSGEGCFFIVIHKSPNSKLGEAVQIKFILVQHLRDEQLMKNIKEYFDCGFLQKNKETVQFTISNFIDLTEKVIPFFENHPIMGVKNEDFLDWCKAAKMIKNKEHLTIDGLNQLKQIKSGMNKGRNID